MFKKFDSQTLLALGVLAVSFIALFISVRQTSIMSEQTRLLVEQNKGNAWPHLEMGLSRGYIGNEEEGYRINLFKINITNKGTGPAIVEAVRVLYDGQASRNWDDFYQKAVLPDSIAGGHSNSTVMNKVIAANEEVTMLNLSNNGELMQYIYDRGEQFVLEICYRSVYDDHWLVRREGFHTNLEQIQTTRVDGCQVKAEELFME